MFTRHQFEDACKAFGKRHPQWTWVSALNPGYGYLMRRATHSRKPPPEIGDLNDLVDEDIEHDDQATLNLSDYPSVNVAEFIVYSASFNVPSYYFTMHDPTGTPLALEEIVKTSLFKVSPPQGFQSNGFALTVPSGSFPLLSQGDHPTLGTPCWYFHPCETEAAVNEFMKEESNDLSEEERLNRWLEIWLMVVGSILNV